MSPVSVRLCLCVTLSLAITTPIKTTTTDPKRGWQSVQRIMHALADKRTVFGFFAVLDWRCGIVGTSGLSGGGDPISFPLSVPAHHGHGVEHVVDQSSRQRWNDTNCDTQSSNRHKSWQHVPQTYASGLRGVAVVLSTVSAAGDVSLPSAVDDSFASVNESSTAHSHSTTCFTRLPTCHTRIAHQRQRWEGGCGGGSHREPRTNTASNSGKFHNA